MPSRDKSPENRFSFGQEVQERAKTLLEALLDNGDEALKFGKSSKTEEIEVTPLNGKSNEPGLEFNVKRNLLANWIGIKTEKLTLQESKNVSEKIKNVVVCLKKFEIISFYKPHQSGWWKLILPHADKNKLIKKLPAFVRCEEAIVKPHQASGEAVDASVRELSSEQGEGGLEQFQLSHPLPDKNENTLEISHNANSIRDWRFKSVDQLWSKDIGECISGIRKLERIAKDYPTEHWAIMKELAEFIRIRARRKEGDEERSPKISPDIQAALTVIGRRDTAKDPENQRLDLSNVDIAGADLSEAQLPVAILREANLQGVNFDHANLQGAIFKKANLQEASFYNTNLQEAHLWKAHFPKANFMAANLQRAILSNAIMQEVNLWGANLQNASLTIANLTAADLKGADFKGANLQGANFMGANLQEVDFAESNLQGTKFQGADLTNAKNLDSQKISSAFGDGTTVLPENVERPARWM